MPPRSRQPTLNLDLYQTQQKTMQQITDIITSSIRDAPRSMQRAIGPSEIGIECDHCLAAKLAGWHPAEPDTPWLPFIGTCVHEHYEHLFENVQGCLVEQKVTVGEILGQPITGSTDLYLVNQLGNARAGMTVDWKIVGDTTLRKVKASGEPSYRYLVQAMLYARGWNMKGYLTSHVCIYFQPRNKLSLTRDSYVWIGDYDEQIALDALTRCEQIARNLQALETISTKARDEYISRLPRATNCYDCKKYLPYETTKTSSVLNQLLKQ